MTGGTLAVTRDVNNHSLYKRRLETLGFQNVTLTDDERDALDFKIRELQPKFLLMDAEFYECCTPYMMGLIKKMFPKITMAAVCIGHYPEEYAMNFIFNGIKSYATSYDGFDVLYKALEEIGKGREYVSPAVLERIEMRKEFPAAAVNITERLLQMIRLCCCGFTDNEVGETMNISKGTVENYKTKVFTALNIRNCIELIRAVLTLGIVKLEELYFYPKGLLLNPKPEKIQPLRRNK
jgi:DNA-binding NarL/FixJ family response regulator